MDYVLNGVPYRGIIHAGTGWVHKPSTWMFRYSAVSAPANRFQQDLPTPLAIWKSYLDLSSQGDWASTPVRNRLEQMKIWAERWDQYIRQ